MGPPLLETHKPLCVRTAEGEKAHRLKRGRGTARRGIRSHLAPASDQIGEKSCHLVRHLLPVGEGAAGAAKKGIEGEAGAAKKGVIEKITEAIGGGEMEEMHPPTYKALEDSASKCVVTGNDCLRHCYGMFSMKDTSMASCANAAFQLVAACAALNALAAVNSEHTGHLAKTVEMICNDCKKECEVPQGH
jgi:Cys-rich four helix bundle protein (predicted Tat secretion target)